MLVIENEQDNGCRTARSFGPLNQRERAVLQGAPAVALSVQVSHLLQLQSALFDLILETTDYDVCNIIMILLRYFLLLFAQWNIK